MNKNYFKKITAFIIIALMSASLAFAETAFTGYTTINSSKQYVYTKAPLGCNYTNNLEKNYCNKGKDWTMSTTITGYQTVAGSLQVNGVTTLTDNNLIAGFTGGTFIVANDCLGFANCIVNAKTNVIVSQAAASNQDAQTYGWGVNPAKLGFYDWKLKVKATTRTCSWQINVPAYVMAINPTITVVQCHTPSNRALREMTEIAQYALSFAISDGLNLVNLIIKAQNGTLTYSDVSNFSLNVVSWAQSQKLITSAQATAAANIINAIGTMVSQGLVGIQPANYSGLVNLASAIEKAVSGTGTGIDNARAIISALQPLMQNQQGFVPPDLSSIITILKNVEVLVQSKLSANDLASFNQVINVLTAINNLPSTAVWSHIDLVFQAINVTLNLSSTSSITPAVIQASVTPLLTNVGTAIAAQYGANSQQMEYYNAFMEVYSNVFVLIANGNRGWNSDNITIITNGFNILASAINNNQFSLAAISQFCNCMMEAINDNGGWNFENAAALAGIIDGLNAFAHNTTIAQLVKDIKAMQKNN